MKSNLLRFVFGVMAMLAVPVGATLVSITVTGPTGLDPLSIASAPYADELGHAAFFPPGEQISFTSIDTTLSANAGTDSPSLTNKLVSITNLTSFSFPDVFFVANAGGTFSNFDGYVNASMAMKIDSVGLNKSLYSESMPADGLFKPGETWNFIVQDWASSASVDWFFTSGVVGGTDSMPSIIVPEPTSVALGLLGMMMLLRRRR